jgi:histone-lysine N-methyltransferase SUV39H
VRRVKKTSSINNEKSEIVMWGLFSLEMIPAGAFVMEYSGEILTAKEGDKRGKVYDEIGMSYLFDMNDPDESDDYEMRVQESSYEDFFPLCIDAAFYGNESRFVNHSCDPNLKSFNLVTEVDGYTFHRIGLFATK